MVLDTEPMATLLLGKLILVILYAEKTNVTNYFVTELVTKSQFKS